MNKLTIIGNLTRDPETRTTSSGINVCSFSVAVNRRRSNQNGQQEITDYFNVSVWRQLGEICQKYLAKGRKVCVVGSVSARTYTKNDGTTGVSLDVNAEDVEFLTPKSESYTAEPVSAPAAVPTAAQGFEEVGDDNDLPF